MSSDVTVKLQLPFEVVEMMRQQAIQSGTTVADLVRQAIANNQYVMSVVRSPDKELLVEEDGRLSRLGLARNFTGNDPIA